MAKTNYKKELKKIEDKWDEIESDIAHKICKSPKDEWFNIAETIAKVIKTKMNVTREDDYLIILEELGKLHKKLITKTEKQEKKKKIKIQK